MTNIDDDTTRAPETKCPSCGKKLDALTAIEPGTKPQPGDITVCLCCGEVMSIGLGLVLQPLSDEQIVALAGDQLLLRVQKVRGEIMSVAEKLDAKGTLLTLPADYPKDGRVSPRWRR